MGADWLVIPNECWYSIFTVKSYRSIFSHPPIEVGRYKALIHHCIANQVQSTSSNTLCTCSCMWHVQSHDFWMHACSALQHKRVGLYTAGIAHYAIVSVLHSLVCSCNQCLSALARSTRGATLEYTPMD